MVSWFCSLDFCSISFLWGYFSFIFNINTFKRFYLFSETGREGEGKGKKHQFDASHMSPTEDLACNPGTCPEWETNRQPFSTQASTHSTEPHWPGLSEDINLKCASACTVSVSSDLMYSVCVCVLFACLFWYHDGDFPQMSGLPGLSTHIWGGGTREPVGSSQCGLMVGQLGGWLDSFIAEHQLSVSNGTVFFFF